MRGHIAKGIKRKLALVMSFIMLLSVIPVQGIIAFAADTDITVTKVEYVRQHNGYTFQSAGITVLGQNLDKAVIAIYNNETNKWDQNYGTRENVGTQMVTIAFTKAQSDAFSGQVRVFTTAGVETFNLNTSNFPVIQASTASVNVDRYPAAVETNNIVLTGTNLDKILAANFTGTIGKTATTELTAANYQDIGGKWQIIRPNPGALGYQDINIEYEITNPTGIAVYTRYFYKDAFRTLRDSNVTTPIEMYPNTGQSGGIQGGQTIPPDTFNIRSDDIPGITGDYSVHFLKTLDGTDKPTTSNQATILSIAPERDITNSLTGKDLMIVRVPNGIATGPYKVVLMDKEGTQIVSETVVGDYTVISTSFNPIIKRLSPNEGADTGENTDIIGDYLLTVRLPGIKGGTPKPNNLGTPASWGKDTETLNLEYSNGSLTYNDQPITSLKRKIKGIVGGQVTFIDDPVASTSDGIEERIPVKLQGVSDAATNPLRDAILTIETEIVAGGITYRFVQEVKKDDVYTFIPRTYIPEVTEIMPSDIQIKSAPIDARPLNELANDVLLAVKGKNFFVDRYSDADGKLVIQYPSILIKTTNNDSPDDYELGFFPNENGGVIKYKDGANYVTLLDADGQPVRFQITVLNSKNTVVNGTTGNELGTKVLLKMPEESLITLAETADEGLKRMQIINPSRKSTNIGGVFLTDENLKFLRTSDVPVIQRVVPSVVTVEGNVDVSIYGSNFREGMKLYLDGEQITNFTREKDISGGTDIVTFKVPPGREGVTQIAIINPSGGMAVHNFTYVSSFQQDPIITDFAPKQGTPKTLVVINGKNFVIPDPSVPTEDGIDGFRLVGTRVYLDGKDVNSYKLGASGEIMFEDYTAPNAQIPAVPPATPTILLMEKNSEAVYSPYRDNAHATYIKNADANTKRVVKLIDDKNGRPAIDAGDKIYTIRAESGNFFAYDQAGVNLGQITVTNTPNAVDPHKGTTKLVFPDGADSIEITAVIDNSLLRLDEDTDGKLNVALADYGESIQLIDPVSKTRYAIRYNFLGQVILYKYNFDEKEQKESNIEAGIYFLEAYKNGTQKIVVQGSNNLIEIVPVANGIEIRETKGAATIVTALKMRTPFTVNTEGQIVGHRAHVLNSGQIAFEVPYLTTGRGYKDVTVINPDTKTDSKTGNNGFLYIPQASSSPVISQIKPEKGSVDGGYYVTITGSDFKDNASVYVDSVLVPKTDTVVSLAGDEIRIKMPKSIKKLNEDFGVDSMTVPVVVTNPDGGSSSRLRGFTYIIPKSSPVLNTVSPSTGSANGGEFVDLLGDEFRFYEPFENAEGGNTPLNDDYEDLNVNGKWDNFLTVIKNTPVGTNKMDYLVSLGLLTEHPLPESQDPNVTKYYTSPILPSVYFGGKEAKIVEIDPGFIRVITPPQPAGTVEVYLINNDSGVSNKKTFTYKTTSPKIDKLEPNFGRRQGQEPKDLFGKELYPSLIYGYTQETLDGAGAPLPIVSQTGVLNNVGAWVRFGEIDNLKIPSEEENSGRIIGQRTKVVLDGGLTVEYSYLSRSVKVTIEESNTKYTREFDNFNGDTLLVPVGMLRTATATGTQYYAPFNYKVADRTTYKEPYEYLKMYIKDNRLFVERGYSPKVTYNNQGHVTAYTPSYYTIGPVKMTYTNTDGGKITVPFTYTNPASEPKIYKVEPQELNFDKDKWLVNSSIDGGIEIEIIGTDFRKNAKVNIGGQNAEVKEITTKAIGGVTYDVIVAKVPKGTASQIDVELPIIVLNEDNGLATSSNLADLVGPNYGLQTLPIYFVYKKPLSGPRIDTITPQKTSVAGGNPITIIGSDFREGAYVVIGTRAGIPITNVPITERGTKIVFTTPTNMTVGPKNVQVINNDYGIAIKEDGLLVVSAPTVSSQVLDGEGNPINRIHVTGGQEILLKGTGFQKGATVYFGGEYLTMGANDKVAENEQGLYRDDSIKYVKGGVKATKVEFIDETTLKITTPEVTFEGNVRIVVRNPDSGITDGNTFIDYTVPIPEDPANLKVTVVDKRYIKLYDYVSKAADYFEIYVYIGTKTNSELISNNFKDFSYLGITDIEPYKIVDLPGLENRASGDRVVFVVKGANKFGPSGYSNLAALTHEDLKDVEELGPPNIDGDIDVPVGEDYEYENSGGKLEVTFAPSLTTSLLEMDFSDEVDDKTTIKRLVLPEKLVASGLVSISANFGNATLRFTPVALNTQTFRTMAQREVAYARVTEDTSMTAKRSYLVPNIRGKKQVSKVHTLSFDVSSNKGVTPFNSLSGTMDYSISYADKNLTQSEILQMRLYKYDASKGGYVAVAATVDRVNQKVTIRLKEGGHYVLLTSR